MPVEPLRDVRNHVSEVVDRVEHEHECVTVTRNGRPVAVIISPEDLEALEETLAVLSDPEALADIREADAAYAAGDVVRGTYRLLCRINHEEHEVVIVRIEHRRHACRLT